MQFLEEAGNLGTMRFINISGGAVLETLGRFDYSVAYSPVAGGLLSLISPDKLFELHFMTVSSASTRSWRQQTTQTHAPF